MTGFTSVSHESYFELLRLIGRSGARPVRLKTFRNMKASDRPEALREAKLKMKKATRENNGKRISLSHPFFWAPFVLVGEEN